MISPRLLPTLLAAFAALFFLMAASKGTGAPAAAPGCDCGCTTGCQTGDCGCVAETDPTSEPPIDENTFALTPRGVSAYIFAGLGDNPTLTLSRGVTYTFNLNAPSHPFFIKTVSSTGSGSAYSTGVTGNGVQVGTVTFAVPMSAPDTLYYVCAYHPMMKGTINIIDPPVLVAHADRVSIRTSAATLDVLANDTGPAGARLSISAVTQGAKGRVSVKNGTRPAVVYTPGRTFTGTDTFTYTLVDDMGHTAQGMVTVTNPFFAWRGTYTMLAALPDSEAAGLLTATLTTAGGVSGKLTVKGKSHTLRGTAAFDGSFTQTFARTPAGTPPLVVNLAFAVQSGRATVSGNATGDAAPYAFGMTAVNLTAPPEGIKDGAYTFFLRPDSTRENPRGSGWAKATLGKTGKLTLTGRLGDNTIFSAGGVLNAAGGVVVYVPLYLRPKGSLAGTFGFAPGPARTLATGSLAWRKPPQDRVDALFPAGFAATISVLGAFYTPPVVKARALSFSSAEGAGNFQASSAGISALNPSITVSPADRVTVESGDTHRLSITIARTTGLLSGSFRPDGATKDIKFTGVLQQEANLGEGLFVGTGQTGPINLIPR